MHVFYLLRIFLTGCPRNGHSFRAHWGGEASKQGRGDLLFTLCLAAPSELCVMYMVYMLRKQIPACESEKIEEQPEVRQELGELSKPKEN